MNQIHQTGNEANTNYELVVKHDQARFLARDPWEMAACTGLFLKEDQILVPYFGVDFSLCIKDAVITYADGRKALPPVYIRMMILHHLLEAKKGAVLAGEFVTMHSLKDTCVHTEAFNNRAVYPLARAFAANLEAFRKAGEALGGVPAPGGDHAFILYAFPTIPIKYIFWDGDDEVPAAANVLFDANVTDFTHPEDVIGLGEYGAYYLIDCLQGDPQI